MKRYIKSDRVFYDEGLIYQKLENALRDAGLSEAVDEISVRLQTRSYKVIIILTAKKYHKKKFMYTIYPRRVDEMIQQAVYEVNAWVTEHSYILKKDAYVGLLSVQDVPIGYVKDTGSGRGQIWLYTTLYPEDSRIARYNPKDVKSGKFYPEDYSEIFVGYSDLRSIIAISPDKYDRWLEWQSKMEEEGIPYNPSTTDFVLYVPSDNWYIEYLPIDEAPMISPDSSELRKLSL